MKWKQDFFVGYSPERINPGDREHTLTRITKVVSGDTPETLERVAKFYASVVAAGVFRASSIKVAEAAKVIENTQRDLNIALMNELALIFNRMGIDTEEVLVVASHPRYTESLRPLNQAIFRRMSDLVLDRPGYPPGGPELTEGCGLGVRRARHGPNLTEPAAQ